VFKALCGYLPRPVVFVVAASRRVWCSVWANTRRPTELRRTPWHCRTLLPRSCNHSGPPPGFLHTQNTVVVPCTFETVFISEENSTFNEFLFPERRFITILISFRIYATTMDLWRT